MRRKEVLDKVSSGEWYLQDRARPSASSLQIARAAERSIGQSQQWRMVSTRQSEAFGFFTTDSKEVAFIMLILLHIGLLSKLNTLLTNSIE
jgi:hypothetical protein